MEADGTLVDEIVPVLKILGDLHVGFLLFVLDGPCSLLVTGNTTTTRRARRA
jgi:hypothetical protein